MEPSVMATASSNIAADTTTKSKSSSSEKQREFELHRSPNVIAQCAIDLSIIAGVCAMLFFFKLGDVGLINPGDAYYTEGAREMVESGKYLLPQLNCQIFFGKPILIFWLIASAYHLFGINEFAGRFWCAVMASVLVITAYGMGRALAGRRAGFFSALVLGSSPMCPMFARLSTIDMVFSSFLWLSLAAFVLTVSLRKRWWWIVCYVALALSILTKGPAGVAFYGATAVAYLLIRRMGWSRIGEILKSMRLHLGVPLFLAVAVPWFWLAGVATHGLWPKVFFLYENVGRFAGVTNCHHSSPLFYIPILAYGFLPWVTFLPAAIMSAFGDGSSARRLLIEQRDGLIVLACWVTAVFLLLSFAGTQMHYYILPIFAPAAVLVGVLLDRWAAESHQYRVSKWLIIPGKVFAIAGPVIAFAAAVGIILLSRLLPPDLVGMGLFGCFVFAMGWVTHYALMTKRAVVSAIFAILTASTVATAMLTPVAFDVSYRLKEQDLYKVTTEVRGREGIVALFSDFSPSVMFYLQRPVHCFFSPQLAVEDAREQRPLYVISKDIDVAKLDAAFPGKFQILDHQGHWQLLLARHMSIIKQPTLEFAYANCLDRIMYDSKTWGPLGVPYAAGIAPAKSSFRRWM